MATVPSGPAPRAPGCGLCVKVMDAEGSITPLPEAGPSATTRLSPCSSGVPGGVRKAGAVLPPLRRRPCMRVCSQPAATLPLARQGPLLGRQHPPHSPLGPAAYSKSPSRYLPKACRTTVLTAMSGFTTQNCRVAWVGEGGERESETTGQAPPLAGRWALDARGEGGPVSSPEGTAIRRENRICDTGRATQLCGEQRHEGRSAVEGGMEEQEAGDATREGARRNKTETKGTGRRSSSH